MSEEKVMIQLADGKRQAFPKGVSLTTIAQELHIKKAIAASINDKVVTMTTTVEEDANITFHSLASSHGKHILGYTAATVLAIAMKQMWPEIKLGELHIHENRFSYDFQLYQSISANHLPDIVLQMQKILRTGKLQVQHYDLDKANALLQSEPFLLEELNKNQKNVSLVSYNDFRDIQRSPLLSSLQMIQGLQLEKISGAYWKGDANNQVLQRISGIAFSNKHDQKSYQSFLKEAEQRNHQHINKDLELFMFSEEAPGMPFYLPKGQIVRQVLEDYLRELHTQHQYDEVRTPFMMNQRLWEQSGHWDHYKENMYFSDVDDKKFALKPMNCPGHMLIYQNKLKSYRDLPIRLAEFGHVHRHEFSGALNGMLRVRSFCQDDAHLFVTINQIEDEIEQIIRLIDQAYQTFGFQYSVELSTRPEKSMGSDYAWEMAETALLHVLKSLNMDYKLNEGDGAFYGPKIDFHIKDALHRSHQCATVQLDFQLPEKFNLSYVDADNKKQKPVVIHRAVFGSLDRFFGILIEHYAGAFPTWLSPVQVAILPVSTVAHRAHVETLQAKMQAIGIRVTVDNREEKLGYRLREAKKQKTPYVLVVGDDEISSNMVNVNVRGASTYQIPIESFIEQIQVEIKNRK